MPDLVLPWMGVRELRDHIHAYVEDHLGPVVFSISLSGDGGFIDLGTHNAGLFRVRARHESAPGRPHHG
ncbi:hypothetical protein KIH31_16830 [Paenarthrobacter sp. DKR-5]|uniref:hypothetical protein n=1 Tax=Paenarthrobacter sp. DKR-5 TaxID=2835535 RepID=UPI001BDCCCC2|nr:hypothetical protein [Paenarthrobacter sp. DKR-5]MBT1004254.1 hypothetical protein [Paenarthrobacter sp. DKR-5]